jgi:hypothetical protein
MTVDPNCAQMSNSLRRQSRLSVHRQSWWTSATVSSPSHSTTKFISEPKLSTSNLSKLLHNDQRSQHTMSTSQPHVRKEQSHLKLAHVISSCDETSIRVFFSRLLILLQFCYLRRRHRLLLDLQHASHRTHQPFLHFHRPSKAGRGARCAQISEWSVRNLI